MKRDDSMKQTNKDFSPKFLTSQPNFVPVYTVLRVTQKIKSELGLEAMLEYIHKYCQAIDEHNPKIQFAVDKALSLMPAEKVYRSMVE